MRRVTAPLFALLSSLFALSCGPSAPATTTYTMPDGVVVSVGADGHATLTLAGRPLGGTGGAPLARAYTETVSELLGGYTFRRSGVVDEAFDHFVSSEQRADGTVVISLASTGSPTDTATIELAPAPDATRITLTATRAAATQSLVFPFACDADASFYSFGEQYDQLDHRGDAFPLWVSEQGIGRNGGGPIAGDRHTTYFPVPYWLDMRGFGVLAKTNRRVLVDLCKTNPRLATIEVEDARPVELLVFHGPGPRDVIRELGDVVGRPHLPPAWAFDNAWIAAQTGHDAVLARAAGARAAGIPTSVIWVQDWSGGRPAGTGGWDVLYRWVADDVLYPDLAGMITTLHGMGFKFLAYANPFVLDTELHYAPMRDMHLLVTGADGNPELVAGLNGNFAHPDFTVPAARTYVDGYLRAMISTYGIDGWMADFAEWLPADCHLSDGSDPIVAHQTYPSAWHDVSLAALDAERPTGDYVVFTRSGWTGEQSHAQIVWIGDQQADWSTTDGLPTVVPAMLNLGLAGVPYVTHDIAGFSGGPSTKELYLRWTELGAFTPVMRAHEGLNRDTNWAWDKDMETTVAFRRFARIHVALAPLFMQLAMEAQTTSMPILRPLALVAPDDMGSRNVSDEFCIGDDLLVAPVVTMGAVERDVYLPPGDWVHVWTGTHYSGGAHVTIPAPLGQPPFFSRGVDRPDLRAIE